MVKLLIIQLLVHLIIDFYGQNDDSCEKKKEFGFCSFHLYLHAFVLFMVSWIGSFSINFIFYAFIIGVSHFVIDGFKSLLKKWRFVFYADQLLHIAIIVIVVTVYSQLNVLSIPEWLPNTRYFLLILGVMICLKPTNVLIKEVFKTFQISSADTEAKADELIKAGRLIGNLERILTLLFVLLSQYEAIGFLIAAKSILRFKDTETAKTEYVLIGTLLSFGVAILIGVSYLKLKSLLS